ncbi:NAD(P)H-binding protein [Vibrio makurazakiensis]|uniref:NAD-dependent epimerase/dehydratase family protein n=1 Tax=Vibrio makurazakiensis TaxID=2910250 RepID=UPI003D0A1094
MTISGDGAVVMIAGASGLIGSHALKRLLSESAISKVYALSRTPFESDQDHAHKLLNIVHPDLQVNNWSESNETPDLGLICLGTTAKQAGSKQALEKVDFELVCHVAQTMKLLGIKRVAVISSYGASAQSLSHYLRCKGHMEQTLTRMRFEQLLILRPGPLVGVRAQPRTDEKWVQRILFCLRPFMLGKLQNLIPIQAQSVADTTIYKLFEKKFKNLEIMNSKEMLNFLSKYE